MTEQQLIHALQQKQDTAFQVLVDEYKDRLYNTVLGFVQNEVDAEDVVQDAFIKIYEHIKNFKGESTLGTWMYKIAVSQALDFLRKKKEKKERPLCYHGLGIHDQEQFEQKDFDHPGVLAENKERAMQLFKAIEVLPENQKTAFVLQKVEGLNQKEIASVMELKEGAVESLLSRAKANLRKSLQQYYSS